PMMQSTMKKVISKRVTSIRATSIRLNPHRDHADFPQTSVFTMFLKSLLSAVLALTAVSALFLSAPQTTHASNDGIDPNRIPTVKPLPDLVISEVAPVYNLYLYVGWMREPDQIWVKV